MKKPALSPDALAQELASVAVEFIHRLPKDVDHAALCDFFGGTADQWHAHFFSVGDPKPAAQRGRGERVDVDVSWIWPDDLAASQRIADVIRERIAGIVGVEAVTTPDLDTQLRTFWGVRVTLRLSQ